MLFAFLAHQNGSAQCVETDETKILLVGDSWAFFMAADQTIDNVLTKWGHSHYKYFTNTTLAENGAETDDFLKPAKQDEIVAQLNAHPEIEVVHLSLGGNDFLNAWNVSFTQAQTDSMLDTVSLRLISVMNFIKSVKPGIQIFWSGYTYPNFEEVIESAAPFQTTHPFYSTWSSMGFPNFTQINGLLNQVSDKMIVHTQTDSQVHFVPASGILQYTFGQTSPLGVAPFGTYAPYSVPLPSGDINYPSPKDAMRNYLITKDCFHLSPKGYEDLISYHTQKFYHKFLMDDLYLLSEGGNKTGSVSSMGNISTSLMLGESAGENFSVQLSFNTTSMADTTLSAASIFLRRKNLSGTNPINPNLQLKIKNGNLGNSADVEVADFNAVADDTSTPCQFGSNNDNEWIRLDLPTSCLPFINRTARTQFLLSSPNTLGGIANFYDATDPDFAPVLNLVYKKVNSAISPNQNIDNWGNIYPNPTKGRLHIEANGKPISEVKLINAVGEVLFQGKIENQKLDISAFANGIYWLNIATEEGNVWKKIIKY